MWVAVPADQCLSKEKCTKRERHEKCCIPVPLYCLPFSYFELVRARSSEIFSQRIHENFDELDFTSQF